MRAEAAMLGIPADIDPGPALLEMVSEAAGNVGFYRSLIGDLGTEVTSSESIGERGSREVPNVIVRMYDAERDRLAQCAALALKAGVEERAVRLAEADVRELASAVDRSLAAAGLSTEQAAAFRAALAEQLHRLGGSAVPVESASRTNRPNIPNEPPSLS